MSLVLARLPLYVKVAVLALALGAGLWAVLGRYQARELDRILNAELAQRLERESVTARMHFHEYLSRYPKMAQVLASHGPLAAHAASHTLGTDERVPSVHDYPPDWLPPVSTWRAIIHPSHILILDTEGAVRDVISVSSTDTPPPLQPPDPSHLARARGQSYITELAGAPYLLAAAAIPGAGGVVLGDLLLAAPLDARFLRSSRRYLGGRATVAALYAGAAQRILVSTEPEQVPRGTTLSDLSGQYLTGGKAFFDGGSSELTIGFATLLPRSEAKALNAGVTALNRTHRLIAAAVFIAVFVIVMLYYSRRVAVLAERAATFARHELGAEESATGARDELLVLDQRFRELTSHVLMAQKRNERYTQELAEANERLKDLDRLKSLFIASMSHELRTPLNSIIGFVGIVLQGMVGELNARQREYLARAQRSAQHLLALIQDVIDISQIEAGRIPASPEWVSLREVVMEAVGNVEERLDHAQLAFEVDVPEGLAVKTDRKRLMQCLLNLLSNAAKYTEKGRIGVVAEGREESVRVAVWDTGIGMHESDLQKLFQPFVRIDSHLSVPAGGTGLGLYLSRTIATEVLGGEISVESRVGSGSTFTLTLPPTLGARQPSGENDDGRGTEGAAPDPERVTGDAQR